jgi:hypothetical protein
VSTRKVYELYMSPSGPSHLSKWYSAFTKQMWHVAAYSVKQAIFLCARGEWYQGGTGILAYKVSNNNGKCWRRWDGTDSVWSGYKHGNAFKDQDPEKSALD